MPPLKRRSEPLPHRLDLRLDRDEVLFLGRILHPALDGIEAAQELDEEPGRCRKEADKLDDGANVDLPLDQLAEAHVVAPNEWINWLLLSSSRSVDVGQ